MVIFGRGPVSEGQNGGTPKKFQLFFLKSFVKVSIGKVKCMIGLTGVWAWAGLGLSLAIPVWNLYFTK